MATHIHILPRVEMTWAEFLQETPPGSIALDGFVKDSAKFHAPTYHCNFDHHCRCVREVTMSTTRQVLFAVKGGLIKNAPSDLHIYMNDVDQDASPAAFLLVDHELIDDTNSNPILSRLIEITDRLDVTGGAFPMHLPVELVEKHNWVFQPYTQARKSGVIAKADESIMQEILQSIFERIRKLLAGEAGRLPLDTRHEVLHESPWGYKLIHEIGGNDARYFLFQQGLNAFVSLVAASEGRYVYSIGRRSRYIPFPVPKLLAHLNRIEPIAHLDGIRSVWGGSDIIGGSPRLNGSRLAPMELAQIIDKKLKQLSMKRTRYGELLYPGLAKLNS